jgi:hypothetical protein
MSVILSIAATGFNTSLLGRRFCVEARVHWRLQRNAESAGRLPMKADLCLQLIANFSGPGRRAKPLTDLPI